MGKTKVNISDSQLKVDLHPLHQCGLTSLVTFGKVSSRDDPILRGAETMSLLEGFAQRLRLAIERSKYSQGEVAINLRLSKSAVSQWLSGKKRPSRENIVEIADLLGVNPGWLEFGDGREPDRDLGAQREDYRMNTAWSFRAVPLDGGRDYGNSNLWSIPWDIDALVREATQNSLDVAIEPNEGISMEFSIYRLNGDHLSRFLESIKWTDGDNYPGLRTRIEQASQSTQKLGHILRDGLNNLEETKHLILLRIDDARCRGLTGPESGESHFAALCRNNLDSRKTTHYSGGSYGLGKSVFWRASRFATVFVNSNLLEPYSVNGQEQRLSRMIGRAELPWHKIGNEEFAGPGWFGVLDTAQDRSASSSVWNNNALANDLHLTRDDRESGTSILVVGFHDNTDDPDDPDDLAQKIEVAVAGNFWPALVAGRLSVRVSTFEGDQIRRNIPVDPEKHQLEFVQALRKFQDDDLVDHLQLEGDVAARVIPLSVPKRKVDPKHGPLDHEAILIVRRDSTDRPDTDEDQAVFFRGQRMVIMTKAWRNLVFGGMPYRAAILCGLAAGETDVDRAAEQLLRAAEPPAHINWEMTPELRYEYVRGGKAAIDRFLEEVRKEIRELIKPKHESLEDGPTAIKRLLKLSGTIPRPPPSPRIIVDSNGSFVDDEGSWNVLATVRVPNDKEWFMTPVLRFAGESGGGRMVEWALQSVSGCLIEGSVLRINPGSRRAVFKGRSDPSSHPVPAKDSAVSVLLRNVRSI